MFLPTAGWVHNSGYGKMPPFNSIFLLFIITFFTHRVKKQKKVWPFREKTLLLQVMYVVWYKNEANEGKYRLDDAAGGTAAVGNSMYADRLLQR